MLGVLERGLVALLGRGALQMDVAAVTVHRGVQTLVGEVELEAELLAIEADRAREIGHPEHRRHMAHSTLMPADLIKRPPTSDSCLRNPANVSGVLATISMPRFTR